jgi:hypothetical protein
MRGYPDAGKALHQVQRNRYYHAHGPTAPEPGITFGQLAESLQKLYDAFASPAQQARMESSLSLLGDLSAGPHWQAYVESDRALWEGSGAVSLLKPFPVDRTRCEACGLLDDDCHCTWTSL